MSFHVLHTDDLCEDSLNAMSSIVFQTRFVTVHVFIEHSSIYVIVYSRFTHGEG